MNTIRTTAPNRIAPNRTAPNRIVLAAVALMMLVLTACVPVVAAEPDVHTIEFDVAEDMNRFIFDQDIAYEDGLPADGSSFITIFPQGSPSALAVG